MRLGVGLLAGTLAGMLTAGAGPAWANEEALALRLRAERLAQEGRCEEALERTRRVRALTPEDGRAALVEGRCLLRLGRHEEARQSLQDAGRLEPGESGLDIELAIAHFHVGDFDGADAALTRAERETPEDPRVVLYRGLLLLERSQMAEAATALESASQLNPESVDPAASYYAGLAWERAHDRKRARAALKRVIKRAPDTEWEQAARRALARIEGPSRVGRFWGRLTAGLDWDDNVILRGSGIVLPRRISDDEDGRGFWGVEGGVDLLDTGRTSAGLVAGYWGNAHFNLSRFNLHYPTASVWLEHALDEATFVRVEPFFGYGWTKGDPYVTSYGTNVSLHRDWDSAGNGRLFGKFTTNNYRFSVDTVAPVGVTPAPPASALRRQRNRDGEEWIAGYGHSLPISSSTVLRGDLRHTGYDSQGREYQHLGFGGMLGLRQQLPFDVVLDAQGRYAYEPYRHMSTFISAPLRKRRDSVWDTHLVLERPLTPQLKIAARWLYTNVHSNTPVYDYQRHILGGFVTYEFSN